MSQSTDAILFFGVALPEEFEAPWGKGDFEEWMAAELGLPRPTEGPISAYWEARRNLLGTAPVQLVMHCSGDYPMYALAARGTVTTANRGSVESITSFEPSNEDTTKLLNFLLKYRLPTDVEWKLVSFWG